MRRHFFLSLALASVMLSGLLAQVGSKTAEQIVKEREAQDAHEAAQQPTLPQAQQAPQPSATPLASGGTAAATAPAQGAKMADQGLLSMDNVNLIEMVNLISKMLKINILVDPRVKGSVTIHTYGEVKPLDLMPLLEVILRVNGSTIVKVGDLYRVVPLSSVSQLPLTPMLSADAKTLPEDEQTVLNLIFLKYATAGDLDKLLAPFYGESASHSTYDAANLLILQDNSRNMRRTMELIGLFDSDTFATKRVHLFEIENSRPSELAKELDTVFKAYSLSDKSTSVHFIAVDRINTLIAVAPNPGIFAEVEKWIDKLDIPVKTTAGSTNNWVYRLKYGRAETVAMAIMALYSGNPMALIQMAQQANSSMYSAGLGMNGTGYGMSGMNGGGMSGGYGNSYGNSYGSYGANSGYGSYGGYQSQATSAQQTTSGNPMATGSAATDKTGSYLGQGAAGGDQSRVPHVIPNPFDNTIMVQGTPQEWEQIQNLLRQLDVAPRQVLIDCKIYEVDLSTTFGLSVDAQLQQVGSTVASGFSQALNAASAGGNLLLSAGMIAGKSKQLLGKLQANETNSRTKVISSPSIIATDSVPAVMNVGSQVPVATSTGLSAVSSSGTAQTYQTISEQSTGVTLNITPRINSSGVVTMLIEQQVSAPSASASSSTLGTGFSNRSLSTQITMQDGDTIAIGGAITETKTEATGGVPYLSRIPLLGALFGSKNNSVDRSELIMFLTPHVIYDTNQLLDATEEIKTNLKRVSKMMRQDHQ
jgi:general secretion pathway protein D